MSWRMDRSGTAIFEPLSSDDIACRDEEISYIESKARPWRLINGVLDSMSREKPWKPWLDEIAASGAATALAGGFAGVVLYLIPGTVLDKLLKCHYAGKLAIIFLKQRRVVSLHPQVTGSNQRERFHF